MKIKRVYILMLLIVTLSFMSCSLKFGVNKEFFELNSEVEQICSTLNFKLPVDIEFMQAKYIGDTIDPFGYFYFKLNKEDFYKMIDERNYDLINYDKNELKQADVFNIEYEFIKYIELNDTVNLFATDVQTDNNVYLLLVFETK